MSNHVMEKMGVIRLAPPQEIVIPPLRTYTFLPVNGRVLARTVLVGNSDQQTPAKKSQLSPRSQLSQLSSQKAQTGGPGSKTGENQPEAPEAPGMTSNISHSDPLKIYCVRFSLYLLLMLCR